MDFLKKLFPKPKPASIEGVKTAPLDPSMVEAAASRQPLHLVVGISQSAGIERAHNEDAVMAVQGTLGGQEALQTFGVFLVADGMGGHRSGEVASAISARTVTARLTDSALSALIDGSDASSEPLQDLVREALEEANQLVVERVPGGGTTVTVAVLLGQQVTLGHVGDSRAYMIEPANTRVLTRDHSLVKRLEELGQLSPEEADTHPQRNVLYRAIGQGANLEVDVTSHPFPPGGQLLLCSDGLWGVITDQDIERIVVQAATPQSACDQLVAAANAAGGPDNITAVLVRQNRS
ncbi:MAG: protein phosphatase 2C domain-containing protein [Anaerolineales bacterium]|nr:protein phosphatase 2C domain-containing protein [Anaerolineales bacterium]